MNCFSSDNEDAPAEGDLESRTYQGRPIAPARKRFSGSIDSHASMNEPRNSGLVTWLSRKLRLETKSFRRRSWMNG